MDADPEFEHLPWKVTDMEVADLGEEVEGQGGYLCRVVVPVADGQSAGHHVGIPDGLHFVSVVVFQDGVEQSVEIVEEIHHLERSAHGR